MNNQTDRRPESRPVDPARPFAVFAHLNTEKAAQYRAILRVFAQAKTRFALQLRPQDVATHLHASNTNGAPPVDAAGIDAALQQLCAWGNLEAHPDTTDVATVDEFYRPRYQYQLTSAGAAAEQALAVFEESIQEPGELQSAALDDIRLLLQELARLTESAETDERHVHRTMTALRMRFDELTSKSQAFIGSLQRTIDLHGIDIEAFLAYKEMLIGYLERFIGELVVAADEIGDLLRRIDEDRLPDLLGQTARRDLADALSPSTADYEAARELWRSRWDGLKAWFIGVDGRPSQAELLRARARASIPALLIAVAGINDRRLARSDRSADLRTLARWFAQTDSDADAHRLWRAAFGLAPARHLQINEETLDRFEARPISTNTSWLDAPPLRISPRLRKTGRHTRRGRLNHVIDRSREKALLAEAAETEARQIAAAQTRLAEHHPTRLSEIGDLEWDEFRLFLDLLGQALAAKVRDDETVEAVSGDGALRITLAPTGDDGIAVIRTSRGEFRGPDHFITISAEVENGAPWFPSSGLGTPVREAPLRESASTRSPQTSGTG
jgi:uncharacterized protein (TIGR02677 family)